MAEKDSAQLYHEAYQQGYKGALLGYAYRSDSLEAAFKLYVQADDKGVLEGYYRAGSMLVYHHYNPKIGDAAKAGLEYFEKACDGGMLTAYETMARIHLEAGNIKEAERIYAKEGERGDPKGFYDQGYAVDPTTY